jgi:hypothetical protein
VLDYYLDRRDAGRGLEQGDGHKELLAPDAPAEA